jgi:ubiquinone/menaquinone biosynthesis C-methylase UbiE
VNAAINKSPRSYNIAAMEKSEYQRIFDLEDDHWWYVGLRGLVSSSIRKFGKKGTLQILDAGCGTGGFFLMLRTAGTVYNMDIASEALSYCAKRGITRLIQGSVARLPFKNSSFDMVHSMDVLYHSKVEDDAAAIMEFFRVLKPDGILLINLPSFESLRGPHDAAIHLSRRYTKQKIRSKLIEAGFQIRKITYRNFFLSPLIAIVRIIRRTQKNCARSDLKKTPKFLNFLLIQVLRLENRLLNSWNLPFGTSVFCIASKP